jgi:hypothetical protein
MAREGVFSRILAGRRLDALRKIPFPFHHDFADAVTSVALAAASLSLPASFLFKVLRWKAGLNKYRLSADIRHRKETRELWGQLKSSGNS